MAFNENGGLPVQTNAAISAGLATAAKAPNLFNVDTTGRELTALFSAGNLANGTVITFNCASANTTQLHFYNTSNLLYEKVSTTSGALVHTLTAETKRIWAKCNTSDTLEVVIKPSKSTPTQKLDIIRSSKTYTSGTDYNTGDYAHIIGIGAAGGGGGYYTGINYGGPNSGAGGYGATGRVQAVALSGNYPVTIGAGGTGGGGGGAIGGNNHNPATNGNAGGTTTGFNLTLAGGNGGNAGNGNTGGNQGTFTSFQTVSDGMIFSASNLTSGSGLNGNAAVGEPGGGTNFSRWQGPYTAPSGDVGTIFVLRYTP
jgi:hypothetical protein